jgi:ABC-type nitrate/sulfonate/bicarbonate transport system permease component
MADTAILTAHQRRRTGLSRVTLLRLGLVAGLVIIWEAASRSGLLYLDVVPSILLIAAALGSLLASGEFYRNLAVTLMEISLALAIGGSLAILIGLVLGANRFLSRAFEPFLYYLGPAPKIIFFPVMLMWFGVGPSSKVAMGAVSCFFPIVLSVAAGMRRIDPVLVRVGRSFNATARQAAMKIYLPAMREPIMNGVRLGLGVAIIGSLLAETKMSNAGVGFQIMQAYSTFDMPKVYALLIVLFGLSIGANELLGRFGAPRASKSN